jgi:hypothetical protein
VAKEAQSSLSPLTPGELVSYEACFGRRGGPSLSASKGFVAGGEEGPDLLNSTVIVSLIILVMLKEEPLCGIG